MPLAFAVYAAALGTQSIVYGKSLAMLLRKSLQGPTQLTHWYTYVALLLFLAFAAFWVVKYSEGERRWWWWWWRWGRDEAVCVFL